MNWTEKDQEQVGQLASWSEQTMKVFLRDPEYQALCKRYHYEESFRTMVDSHFKGMGRTIVAFTPHGLFWRETTPGSSGLKPVGLNRDEKKMILDALITFGVAAAFYPRAEDLDQPDEYAVEALTLDEIHVRIRQMGERAQKSDSQTGDPTAAAADNLLLPAYRYLFEIPETREGEGRQGRPRATLREMILSHLKLLETQYRFVARESGGRYRPMQGYKIAIKLGLSDPKAVKLFAIAWKNPELED